MPRRQFIFLIFLLLLAALFNFSPAQTYAQNSSPVVCQDIPLDPELTGEIECSIVVTSNQVDRITMTSISFSAVHHESCPPALGEIGVDSQERLIQVELVDPAPDLECPQALVLYTLDLGPFELSDGNWDIEIVPEEGYGGSSFSSAFTIFPEVITQPTVIFLPIVKN